SASAAVLLDKLEHDAEWTARRREIAARYDEVAERIPTAPGNAHVFHKYVIRSPHRDELRDELARAGVPTLVHYALPLPRQPLFAPAQPCPRADQACAAVLSLPIHAFLTDAEVEQVRGALQRIAGMWTRLAPGPSPR